MNGQPFRDYLCRESLATFVMQPLVALENEKAFNININVNGGGLTGQAGAIRLGISRALLGVNDDYRAILKEKDRHRQDAEFTGELGQRIRVFFHAVAHKDQRTDGTLLAARLLTRMFQQPADLGLSCCTAYRGHALLQNVCLGRPGRCLEFAETAVVGKLDFDPAHGRGGFKHLRLDVTGPVP